MNTIRDLIELGKFLRKVRGPTSQESLASAIGVSASTISLWENGQQEATYGGIVRAGLALGVKPNELFLTDEPAERGPVPLIEERILRAVRDMDALCAGAEEKAQKTEKPSVIIADDLERLAAAWRAGKPNIETLPAGEDRGAAGPTGKKKPPKK